MNHADPETAPAPAIRIAMWSGPRTVSTALMRAWENRPDTVVADEPLYAFYLDRTGLDHPGRDEVIASQPTDWRVVLAGLTSALLPAGAVISYAKHMTHHLLPEVDRAAVHGDRRDAGHADHGLLPGGHHPGRGNEGTSLPSGTGAFGAGTARDRRDDAPAGRAPRVVRVNRP